MQLRLIFPQCAALEFFFFYTEFHLIFYHLTTQNTKVNDIGSLFTDEKQKNEGWLRVFKSGDRSVASLLFPHVKKNMFLPKLFGYLSVSGVCEGIHTKEGISFCFQKWKRVDRREEKHNKNEQGDRILDPSPKRF